MSNRIKPLGGHGVVTRTEILASGMTRTSLQSLIEAGEMVRLDRSRFALPGTEASLIRAVAEGGTLTCMSALKLAGVAVIDDDLIHLRRPTCRRKGRNWVEDVTECSIPPRRSTQPPGTDQKFQDQLLPWPDHPLDGVDAALRVACSNHSDEHLAVVLDSILHRRLRTRAELHALLEGHSNRVRRLLPLADAGSESVLESVVRHRLSSRGIAVKTQVQIPGLGRVDMLLGRSLVLEADGYEFHADRESFREDRRRDRIAAAQGYSVIRLTWEQVLNAWPQILEDISSIVSSRRHRRPPIRSNADTAGATSVVLAS